MRESEHVYGGSRDEVPRSLGVDDVNMKEIVGRLGHLTEHI